MANITSFTIPELPDPRATEAIQNAVRPMPGVEDVVVNVPYRIVNVEHDPSRSTPDALRDAIERAGYRVQRYGDGRR